MNKIKNQVQAKFRGFRRSITLNAEQLDDVGTIVDEDLYKRDILIAAKKIGAVGLNCSDERVNAIKDLGNSAWAGGLSTAKFAGNYLMHLIGILSNPQEAKEVKMYTILAIGNICFGVPENQEKARAFGILQLLTESLEGTDPDLADLRRCTVSTLLRLTADNYESQKAALEISRLPEILKNVAREDWSCWEVNEAETLNELLGFDRHN